MKLYGVKSTAGANGALNQSFANHGMVTHVLVDFETASRASGSTTVSILAATKLHVALNGKGSTKIIDGLTLYELASICDQDGGAVVFDDDITATGGFKCRMAIPVGAFDLSDGDSLDCELQWPTPGAYTTFKAELGIADDGTRVETGVYQYTRTSLTFGAANSTLDRNFTDTDLVKVWVFDSAATPVWENVTVQVPEGREGGGTGPRELWEAMTFQTSEASSLADAGAIWNAAIVVYSEDSVTAHGSGCTVLVSNGSTTGTITLLMLSNRINQKRVSASTQKNAQKTALTVARLEQTAPEKAKAFRHIGLVEKASVAQQRAAIVNSAQKRAG